MKHIGDRIYGWIRRPETPLPIKMAIRPEDVQALVAEFRAAENDALERAAIVCDRMHALERSEPEQGCAAAAAAEVIRGMKQRD